MTIVLIVVVILIAGAVFAATRMPRGRSTGNPTVDERDAGEN